MDFEDRLILLGCDDFVGSAILAEAGLRNVILSTYDLHGQIPSGPFTYSSDELTAGGFGYRETEFRSRSDDTRREIEIADDAGQPGRIDFLWRGKVRANASYPLARVDVASLATVGLAGLDSEIPGTIPTDPATLETARRKALLERFKAVANDPGSLDDAVIERLIQDSDAGSLGALMALEGGPARFAELVLSLTEIRGSGTVRAQDFSAACAILARDVGRAENTLSAMLQASRTVLMRLDQAGFAPNPAADLPQGRACVVWIVDAAWFDQADWPGTGATAGALRANRIARASTWLAAQGIALNPVSLP